MNKKLLSLLVLAAMLVSLAGAAFAAESAVFEGVGQGKNGEIVLKVTVTDGAIAAIECVKNEETPGYADAIAALADQAVAANSVNIDAFAGATYTSDGFFAALKDALAKAGLNPEALKAKEAAAAAEKTAKEETHRIVVVGAGGAGLIAAISAKLNGAEDVVLLEQMPFVGGNTLISGAEYAAPGNWLQKKEGVEDSADKLYEDVMKAGGNPDLVRVLADRALEGAEWLRDEANVTWTDEMMFFGGHSVKRSLIPLGATGTEMITKLKAHAEKLGVDLRLNTRATELIKDDKGAIVGVKAESETENLTFHTKAVILTTGGFGDNVEMRKANDPNVDEKVLSTNARGINGDGIIMGQAVGAGLTGMEHIQLYPICNCVTGALLYVDDTRLMGKTIIVNEEGVRFVEELGTRYEMSMAIKAQTGSVAYELMTVKAAEESGVMANHMPEVKDLLATGLMVECATIRECAEKMGVNADALEKTVEKWNGYAAAGKDEDFNKRGTLHAIDAEGPYWLVKVAPAVHHTMGGLTIDTAARVLSAEGNVIPGLYAAGETTGGIHGANRLGSCAIADITVFGRIAGETAAGETK